MSVAPNSTPRSAFAELLAGLSRLSRRLDQHATRPRARAALALIAVAGLFAGLAQSLQPVPATRAGRASVVEPAPAAAPAPGPADARKRGDAAVPPAVPKPAPADAPAVAAAAAPGPPQVVLPAAPKTVAFEGLGTWIDAYDFSRELTRSPQPAVRPEDVDEMAAKGVKTIYIQASMRSEKAPNAILSPDLLEQFVERAHAKGMYVVAWYLPRFEAHEKSIDLLNTLQMKNFRTRSGQTFDAIAVDIEWVKSVPDHQLRSAILVDYSQQLRRSLGPDYPIGAITMPPVQTEIVNTSYWPGYPYEQLKPEYDVWMTMGYWTDRKESSGWRNSYNYTMENLNRLKARLGPDVKIHPIGGIGNQSSPADYDGFVRAARDQGAIGASIYDWATQARDTWPVLKNTPSPYAQQLGAAKAQAAAQAAAAKAANVARAEASGKG